MVSELRRRGRALLGALAAIAALTAAGPAAAQAPSAADKETARGLMDAGHDKMAAKDHAGALKAYLAADAIMRLPMTGIAVARAQAAAGLLVEARDKAIEVTHLPMGPNETAPYAKARADADALVGSLTPRIASVQITLTGAPPDVVIAVDGVPLLAAAATAPRKVNPGKHQLTATAPGFETAQTEVVATEGATLTVPLEMRRGSSAPVGGGPIVPPVAEGARSTSPLMVVGFAVGGAGLVVGTITGVLSLTKTATLKGKCRDDGGCPASLHDDRVSANTLGNVSNVGFGIGIAGAAAGVVGLLITRPKAGGAARIEPLIGPASLGLRGAF